MKIFEFKTTQEKDVIIIEDVLVDDYKVKLILDTGASTTVIDSNSLYVLGYFPKDFYGHTEFETASGVIEANYLKIKKFKCLGIEINNFQICTYDFAVSGITPEFDGMLGIDFFQNNKICIDFIKSELTIS